MMTGNIKMENYCELYNILWVISTYYCSTLDEIQADCDYTVLERKVKKLVKYGLIKKHRINKLWYATSAGRAWLELMSKTFGE